jgi:alpha-ribazole phosphatase
VKLLLIRHGLTRLGEEKRYQGALDLGLSEKGRAELKAADFAPARVYVSPLRRARETAEILFPSAEFIAVSDLREMNFGVFEGRGWWEMESDPAYRAWVDGGCAGRCPGGEGRAEFSDRVCAAMRELLQRERETLVIVAHGGTQMAALEKWGAPARPFYAWQRPCGCGWALTWDGEKMRVLEEVDYRR